MLATLGLVGLLAAQSSVAVRSAYLDAVRQYGPGTERDAIVALHAAALRHPDQVFDELDDRICAAVGARSCRPHHLIAAGREAQVKVAATWRRLYPRALALHVEALASCDPTRDTEAMRLHLLVLLRLVDRIDELAREHRDIPEAFARLATTGRHLVLWALQYLRQVDGLDTAVRAFEKRLTEDVDVRLARGALEELRTLPEAVAASARERDLYDAFARDRMLAQEERRTLKVAVRVYEQLLIDHPASLEARLRLAHLLLRLGQPAEAETHLDRAARLGPDARQAYLMALFLADVYERRGRPADAIAAYGIAGGNWPGAQAPAIGLARLLTLEGRHAEGKAALGPLDLDRPADAPERSDPWVGYIGAQGWRLPAAIIALQDAFEAEP